MASLEEQIRKEKEENIRLTSEYEKVQKLEKVSKTSKDVIAQATVVDPINDQLMAKDNVYIRKKSCCNLL